MLIGLHGLARSGKDTLAQYLVDEYDFVPLAFADPIRQVLGDLLMWDDRHFFGDLKEIVDPDFGFSPRMAMQALGDFGRRLNPDFWIIQLKPRLGLVPYGANIVITDIRMENEAAFVRNEGGVVVCLRAPGREGASGGYENHVSESGIAFCPTDIPYVNDGSIKDLYDWADAFLSAGAPV